MGNLLELQWEVDSKGYVLDGQKKKAPVGAWAHLTRAFVVDEDEGAHAHVVPRGGPPKPYKCKADDLSILHDLLNMPDTPAGVLRFVNRWGLLAPPSSQSRRRVQTFYVERIFLALSSSTGLPRPTRDQCVASLELTRGPNGRLFLRANTLNDFLWAQVFQLKDGAIFQCPICKEFARAPKTGRPPKYCSDACSSKAYRQGLTATARKPIQKSARGGPRNGSTLDLVAWARGERDYITAEVRLAIAARFGKLVDDYQEAIKLLIDEGVIAATDAREDV